MWKNTQRSWVGGRLDAELAGRQDLSRYFQGAGEILNFTVRRQGLLSKRGGTTLVAALPAHEQTNRKTLNHGGATLAGTTPWNGRVAYARLVALSAETDEGYYVLLTDIAEQGDGRARIVTADGGLVGAEVEVPWDGADFAELVFTQSGDTLIVTHMAYRPSRLVRTGTDLAFSYLPIGEVTATPPKITKVSATNVDGGTEKTATARYVYYKATAVVDGVESEPSEASYTSYLPPWKDGGTIAVAVGPNENETVPDYYNVYKKSGGSDYGYIGRAETSDATLVAGNVSSVDDATWLAQYGAGTTTQSVANAWIMTALPATCGWKKAKGTAYNGWAAAKGADTITATLKEKSTIRSVTVGLGTVITTVPAQSSDLGDDNKYEWTYSIVFVPFLNATMTLTLDGADAATVAVPAEAREWREELRSIRSAKIPTAATVCSDAASAVEKFASACKVTVKVEPTAATTIGIKAGNGTVTVDSTTGEVKISGGSPPVIYGIVVTTGSKTSTFTDDYITPDLTTTFHDRGVTPFTQVGDYPAACAFYQQRLCLAGTESDPARLRMSATGDLWEFDPHVSVREDDALDAELASTEFPRINHLLFFRDLLAFTDGGTWLIAPVSGNAISYKTFSAKRQSAIGCDRGVPPMVVGDEVLFVKAGGQSVISTRYNYSEDGYSINDLTVLSQWMFKENRIVSAAYRQEPDSWIYCVLADGTLAVLVYMKEQELCAWTRMTLGGGWLARGAASSRAISRSTSEMLLLVQDADGAFALWRMDDDVKAGDAPRAEDFLCLDRKRVLEDGEEAMDGETVVDCGGKRIAGLAYEARMTTMRPEPQGANATIQFEVRNAKDAEVRVLDSGTFTIRAVGVPESLAVDAGIETKVAEDGTVGLATADVRKVLAGRSGTDGRVEIKSTTPWPLNVLSLSVDYEIQTLSGSEG